MKYYCIGIKGSGMSSLAQILYDLGNEVIGYDDEKKDKYTQIGLNKRNIKIYYDNSYQIKQNTIITCSAAFDTNHPEIQRIINSGFKITPYNKIISQIINNFISLGISGTHGKTTTVSIVKSLFDAYYGCNYFIGAGDGQVNKDNDYLAIECDEFNKHFLEYTPNYSIITNIELEHLECYKNIDEIIKCFEQFANQTKKLVIACGDNENIHKINFKTKVLYYGFNENNDYIIKNINLDTTGSFFEIYHKDNFIGKFYIPLYGKHMILDATAAIILALENNIDILTIQRVLKTFQNAKKRFSEEKVANTIIIDDYAHHPTEISATLDAVKQKYPNKQILAIFKPNTYSRTKDFFKEFAMSLNKADYIYITDIESNREKQSDYPNITSDIIKKQINENKLINFEDIHKIQNAIICIMSCANTSNLIDKIKKMLNKNN